MRSRIWVVLVAVFSASLFFAALQGVAQDDPVGVQKKIVELKMKRRDVLKQRVDVIETRIRNGTVEPEFAIGARDDLYQAELALASAKGERVKLSQQRFESLVAFEKLTAGRYANGDGPIEDKLVATAARLQAEMDLLKEQSGTN